MAHGNPIYYVCKECKHYILNGRFSSTPICKCGKKTEQISKNDLKVLVNLSFMDELSTSMNNWIKY